MPSDKKEFYEYITCRVYGTQKEIKEFIHYLKDFQEIKFRLDSAQLLDTVEMINMEITEIRFRQFLTITANNMDTLSMIYVIIYKKFTNIINRMDLYTQDKNE